MSILNRMKNRNLLKNAETLLLIAKQKTGKTLALIELINELKKAYGWNGLFLDFENGAKYYPGEVLSINTLDELNQLNDEFTKSKVKYDIIVLDTITSLYGNILNTMAIRDYNSRAKKEDKIVEDSDVTTLDWGLGHKLKRTALQRVLNFFKNHTRHLILSGHVDEKSLKKKDEEVVLKDLDIEGKSREAILYMVDATGIFYRKSKDINAITFQYGLDTISATRVFHLSNKDIEISKRITDKDGNQSVLTKWTEIYKNV